MICYICLNRILDIKKLNCNHKFCKYCINQWILIKKECPLC